MFKFNEGDMVHLKDHSEHAKFVVKFLHPNFIRKKEPVGLMK